MTSSSICPRCHSPLADAPDALCPACLLAGGLHCGEDRDLRSPPPALAVVVAAFPQWKNLRYIASGGMAHVYEARQSSLDRLEALKLICHDDVLASEQETLERFKNEGRKQCQGDQHPNIVRVHSAGQSRDECFSYISMEFMPGGDLAHALQQQRITSKEALALMPGICAALQHAHSQGILHRDIKPSNILLSADLRTAKLADFGLCKSTGPDQPSHTRTGVQLGTVGFIAPEGNLDSRSDIYALGCVLAHIHQADTQHTLPAPDALSDIIDMAKAHIPNARYQTAQELQEALATLDQKSPPPASTPPSPVTADSTSRIDTGWDALPPEHKQLLKGTFREHGDPSRIGIEFDDYRIAIEEFDLSFNATIEDVQFVLGRGRTIEVNIGENSSTFQRMMRSLLCIWDDLGIACLAYRSDLVVIRFFIWTDPAPLAPLSKKSPGRWLWEVEAMSRPPKKRFTGSLMIHNRQWNEVSTLTATSEQSEVGEWNEYGTYRVTHHDEHEYARRSSFSIEDEQFEFEVRSSPSKPMDKWRTPAPTLEEFRRLGRNWFGFYRSGVQASAGSFGCIFLAPLSSMMVSMFDDGFFPSKEIVDPNLRSLLKSNERGVLRLRSVYSPYHWSSAADALLTNERLLVRHQGSRKYEAKPLRKVTSMACDPHGTIPSDFLLGCELGIVINYLVVTLFLLIIGLNVADGCFGLSSDKILLCGLVTGGAGILAAIIRGVIGFQRIGALDSSDPMLGRTRELRRGTWGFYVDGLLLCFEGVHNLMQRDHRVWQIELFCRWVDLLRAFPNAKFVPDPNRLESSSSGNAPISEESHPEQAGIVQVIKRGVLLKAGGNLFDGLFGWFFKGMGCLVSLIMTLVSIYFVWRFVRG